MGNSTTESAEARILSGVIAPDQPFWNKEIASELLKWGFAEHDQLKMSELAAKARDGQLSPSEAEEAEAYERVASFLGLVKSKARRSLALHSNE